MRSDLRRLVCALALCSCTEREKSAPPATVEEADTVFEGLVTQVVFGQMSSLGHTLYLPQSPKPLRIVISYNQKENTVELPTQCAFEVGVSGTRLSADDVGCVFFDDSTLPDSGVRSKWITHFSYDFETSRLELVETLDHHIINGEYGLAHAALQGAAWAEDELLKHPSGTRAYEYKRARFYTYQPKDIDDESGCDERTLSRSEYAAGILVEEESGELLLSGWGCSTDFRGSSDELIHCEYTVDLPEAVPQLWLNHLELSEDRYVMKGEFLGDTYRYCFELEAEDVTRL